MELSEFRERVKSAQRATDLVDLIDRALLTEAGWQVHTDSRNFIGAIKITGKGDEYELRCSRLNKSIAGTMSMKRRPPKLSVVNGFKAAMGNAFAAQELTVRKFTSDELGWQELVKQI